MLYVMRREIPYVYLMMGAEDELFKSDRVVIMKPYDESDSCWKEK